MKASQPHRATVLLLAVTLLVTGLVAPSPRAEAAGARDLIEGALPPGARQVLAGIRVIDGLGARNRVYREADRVERELRTYYDARIEKAQQQLLNRDQIGLHHTQVAAYGGVVTLLRNEEEAAIQLTEDEKRAAKAQFEGRLRTEILGAVARSPKGQEALRDIRDVFTDVRDKFGEIQAAIEGGNPISIMTDDLQEHINRLRSAGAVMSILSGSVGAELSNKAEAAQRLVDEITGAGDEAAAVGREALDALDGAIGTLDSQIDSPRRARAATDLLSDAVLDEVLTAIFTPGGDTPVEDLVADAIARGFDRGLVQNVGVALGEIDPGELRTMRERIRARLLTSRIASISEQCGRVNGERMRVVLAALGSDAPPPESVPCPLFQNPEALEEFIRSFSEGPTTTTPATVPSTTTTHAATSTTAAPATTMPEALAFPRTYMGGGSAMWSLSMFDGGCLVEGQTMEVTLRADGTLTGSYRRIEPQFSRRSEPGGTRETLECSGRLFVLDPVELTGSHTPPGPGAGAVGTVAIEIVGWPEWHIEGQYTAGEMTFRGVIATVATGYQGDDPDPRSIRDVDYKLVLSSEG